MEYGASDADKRTVHSGNDDDDDPVVFHCCRLDHFFDSCGWGIHECMHHDVSFFSFFPLSTFSRVLCASYPCTGGIHMLWRRFYHCTGDDAYMTMTQYSNIYTRLVHFSGLVYLPTREGTGASPAVDSTVEVHYHGTLTDGTVFDSSVDRGQTISFPLGGVIKGWQEGLQLMKEGGKATLICPPDLAYGEAGSGDVIPPGATLQFEVELFKVNAAG